MEQNTPDGEYEQMEDAAFWLVEGEYGIEHWPIDSHAIYGWLNLGNREVPEDIPHRNYLRSLETAIAAVREGDRVRVNDRGWMEVTEITSDGFRAVPEKGRVEYEIWRRYVPERLDAESGPRMFKVDGFTSQGRVHCLEIDWAER